MGEVEGGAVEDEEEIKKGVEKGRKISCE